jgi:protein disulfide-isomerase
MKRLLVVLLVAFTFNGFSQQKPLEWHTDVNKAIKISVETEKPLFFFFTGSDWCGWCKRLQKEVFFKPEFAIWANKNVVLVELDFPRRTKLSAELQKQNRDNAKSKLRVIHALDTETRDGDIFLIVVD